MIKIHYKVESNFSLDLDNTEKTDVSFVKQWLEENPKASSNDAFDAFSLKGFDPKWYEVEEDQKDLANPDGKKILRAWVDGQYEKPFYDVEDHRKIGYAVASQFPLEMFHEGMLRAFSITHSIAFPVGMSFKEQVAELEIHFNDDVAYTSPYIQIRERFKDFENVHLLEMAKETTNMFLNSLLPKAINKGWIKS